MVVVFVPIRGIDMYLNIADPILSINAYVCICEIWSSMDVVLTYRHDLNGLPIRSELRKTRPNALLPYVMQEYLWHPVVIIACKGSEKL